MRASKSRARETASSFQLPVKCSDWKLVTGNWQLHSPFSLEPHERFAGGIFMPAWWRGWFARTEPAEVTVADIRRRQADYAQLGDNELRTASRKAGSIAEVFALTAIVAERIL